MLCSYRRLFFCATLLLLAPAANAKNWLPLGYHGARISDLLYDASDAQNPRLLAGTIGAGAFESFDQGSTWARTLDGLQNKRVTAFASAPAGKIYAATQDEGVFVYRAGDGWNPRNLGLPTISLSDPNTIAYKSIDSIAVNPFDGNDILVLISNQVWHTTTGGVVPPGWVLEETLGGQANAPGQLAFSPSVSGHAFLALHSSLGPVHHWFYSSANGGRDWTPRDPISSLGLSQNSQALFVDPQDPNVLLLGLTGDGNDPGTLFRSTDGGASWQVPSSPPPKTSIRSFLGASIDGTGYVLAGTGKDYCDGALGLYVSIDQGQSWTLLSSDLAGSTINSLAWDGETLFAGTGADSSGAALPGDCGRGVFRSDDLGESWKPANRGIVSDTVPAVAVTSPDPQDPNDTPWYFASNRSGGLYFSKNEGKKWRPIRGDLPPGAITGIALDESVFPPNLFVLLSFGPSAGLYRSDDIGRSWASLRGDPNSSSVLPSDTFYHRVFLDPNAPAHLIVAAQKGIYESNDGGQTWTRQNAGLPLDFFSNDYDLRSFDQLGEERVLATNSNGVFRTGTLWGWVSGSLGLPRLGGGPLDPYAGVYQVLWDRLDPNGDTLYAGTSEHGFYSNVHRGAMAWQDRNVGLPSIQGGPFNSISSLVQDGAGTLFLATVMNHGFFSGLFKSADGGMNWAASNAGAPRSSFLSLALGGPADAHVLLGTEGAGLFISADGGATFAPAEEGFQDIPDKISGIAVNPLDPNQFWLATKEDGIFTTQDRGRTFRECSLGLGSLQIDHIAAARTTLSFSAAQVKLEAGTPAGFFYSVDLCESWLPSPSLPTGAVSALLLLDQNDPNVPPLAWVGIEGQGLYGFDPNTSAFQPAGGGMTGAPNNTVTDIVFDPPTGLFFAGTAGQGVFESPTGWNDWFPVNTGLTDPNDLWIYDLELEPPTARGTRQPGGSIWAGSRSGTSSGGGVRRGTTLVWHNNGIHEETRSVKYDPASGYLYAGTLSDTRMLPGAKAEQDAWQNIGGPTGSGLALLPGPDGQSLILGSSDDGIYARAGETISSPPPVPASSSFSLFLLGLACLSLGVIWKVRLQAREQTKENQFAGLL